VPAEVVDVALTRKERLEKSASVVHKSMYWSAGLGLIPVTLVNWGSLLIIQVNMLRVLSKSYGVPFRKEPVKKIVAVLIGSTAVLPATGASILLRNLPLVGLPLSVASLPIFSGAFTYAVGKNFVQHFESGGTFLTFNPDKVREHFMAELENGKKVATAG
jgi:uncharacterized protein (DUF697 family)